MPTPGRRKKDYKNGCWGVFKAIETFISPAPVASGGSARPPRAELWRAGKQAMIQTSHHHSNAPLPALCTHLRPLNRPTSCSVRSQYLLALASSLQSRALRFPRPTPHPPQRQPPAAMVKPVVSAMNAWTWYVRLTIHCFGKGEKTKLMRWIQHRGVRVRYRHSLRHRRPLQSTSIDPAYSPSYRVPQISRLKSEDGEYTRGGHFKDYS